jgi:hypothetical protein
MLQWVLDDALVHFIIETLETLGISGFEGNPGKERPVGRLSIP